MDALTAFGLLSVSAMLVCYALEDRAHWFVLAFAASCALASAYGFLQGAWPFGLVSRFRRLYPFAAGTFYKRRKQRDTSKYMILVWLWI